MGIVDKALTLRHLRYFAAAAEAGSLAGAARRLRVAQPALSRQIQELENICRSTLFVRDRRGVELTDAGSALLAGVGEAFDSLAFALRQTRMAHEGRVGRIRLGFARVTLHTPRTGRAIAALQERYPDVELVITDGSMITQTSRLLAGELDIGVGLQGSAEDPAIAATVLYKDPLDAVALSVTHPLASRESIHIAELRAFPLLSFDPRVAAAIPELFRAFADAGFDSWERHQNLESIYTRIAVGQGWAPMPHSFVTQPPEGTVVRRLEGFRIPFQVAARHRADDESPLTRNIVEGLRDAMRDESMSAAEQRREPAPMRSGAQPETVIAGTIPEALELRHLRAVYVVAEERSLRVASTRLGLTQSGLSRQLGALERAIDVRLLERHGARLVLTPAGRVWRDLTTEALQLLNNAIRAAGPRDAVTTCTIGVMPSESAGPLLMSVLRDFGERDPRVLPEVRELITTMQVPALRAGQIDVGIAGGFPQPDEDSGIVCTRLREDTIDCVLISRSNPLATRESIEATELCEAPFVFLSRAFYPRLYDVVLDGFQRLGLSPRMYDAVDGARAIWRIVADTNGYTVGLSSMRGQPPAGLVAVPVRGLSVPLPIHLLWRREEQDPAVLAVVEAFRARQATPNLQDGPGIVRL